MTGRTGALVSAAALVLAAGCGAAGPEQPGTARASAQHDGLAVHLSARASTSAGTVHVAVQADAAHAPGALTYAVHFGDGAVAHNRVPQFCVAVPGPHRQATWRFTHRYARSGTYHLSVRVGVNCTATAVATSVSIRVG